MSKNSPENTPLHQKSWEKALLITRIIDEIPPIVLLEAVELFEKGPEGVRTKAVGERMGLSLRTLLSQILLSLVNRSEYIGLGTFTRFVLGIAFGPFLRELAWCTIVSTALGSMIGAKMDSQLMAAGKIGVYYQLFNLPSRESSVISIPNMGS